MSGHAQRTPQRLQCADRHDGPAAGGQLFDDLLALGLAPWGGRALRTLLRDSPPPALVACSAPSVHATCRCQKTRDARRCPLDWRELLGQQSSARVRPGTGWLRCAHPRRRGLHDVRHVGGGPSSKQPPSCCRRRPRKRWRTRARPQPAPVPVQPMGRCLMRFPRMQAAHDAARVGRQRGPRLQAAVIVIGRRVEVMVSLPEEAMVRLITAASAGAMMRTSCAPACGAGSL